MWVAYGQFFCNPPRPPAGLSEGSGELTGFQGQQLHRKYSPRSQAELWLPAGAPGSQAASGLKVLAWITSSNCSAHRAAGRSQREVLQPAAHPQGWRLQPSLQPRWKNTAVPEGPERRWRGREAVQVLNKVKVYFSQCITKKGLVAQTLTALEGS